MGAMHKVKIRKLSFPLDGVYNYDVQLLTSIDGGKNFYHCGIGRYCKDEREAEEQAALILEEYQKKG